MNDYISHDELRKRLSSDPTNKKAMEFVAYLDGLQKAKTDREIESNKPLNTHELIVKLSELLEAGSKIAASLKESVELLYSKDYKNAPDNIKNNIKNNKHLSLEKFSSIYDEWFLETAYAISRYAENTYHLDAFIRDRNSYKIIRKVEEKGAEELLADFGQHLSALETIIQRLEEYDVKPVNDNEKLDAGVANEIIAHLSFESLTIPSIKVGEETYNFSSMRLGIPFNVISYCWDRHPNKAISLKLLKEELKAHGINTSGLTNIKESIRNSLFGEKHVLSVFIEVSSQSIMVKPTVPITKEQQQKIKKASQKSNDVDSE